MYKLITDFIRELYGNQNNTIPLHAPLFNGNEKRYVEEAIDSTYVSSVGAFVDRFEDMMTKITGAKYAVAVVNGTAALHIALKLAGVQQNDEVLTQPLTFVATANAISYEKAIPHFIDVDGRSLGMSARALEVRLADIGEIRNGYCYNKESGNRISVCVPMHTFGLPTDIDQIAQICQKYNINVVEDAAESLGSYSKRRHTGTFGLIGAFSFNGNKIVTSGGGGAVVTDDSNVAKLAKHITTTAKVPHQWDYVHDQVGYNYRMPNLNAALACAQLEQLEDMVSNKRATAQAYHHFFDGISDVEIIKEREWCNSNYWLNAIRFTDEQQKDEFLNFSNSRGVMTRPIWRLMNNLEMFKNCPKGDLTVSQALERTIVNIPSSVRI